MHIISSTGRNQLIYFIYGCKGANALAFKKDLKGLSGKKLQATASTTKIKELIANWLSNIYNAFVI